MFLCASCVLIFLKFIFMEFARHVACLKDRIIQAENMKLKNTLPFFNSSKGKLVRDKKTNISFVHLLDGSIKEANTFSFPSGGKISSFFKLNFNVVTICKRLSLVKYKNWKEEELSLYSCSCFRFLKFYSDFFKRIYWDIVQVWKISYWQSVLK